MSTLRYQSPESQKMRVELARIDAERAAILARTTTIVLLTLRVASDRCERVRRATGRP